MNETTFKLTESELKQDPEQLFTLMDKLGEGSYGAVFKAMHKKSSVVVALKVVPVEDDLDDIIKEINVLNGCDSPAIVKYYGSFFKNDHLWMFMEFCPAGSVSDIMKLTRSFMSESEIAVICRAALNGLQYLHERRKIHRDIKAGNILLNLRGDAKLADFGVAGQLSDTVAKRNTVIGTPFWMAPEIIQEVGYGVEADIWSLGITCIEMAEGKPPYYNIHPMRAIFIIPTRPPPTLENPKAFSQEFNNFIAECLTKNPAQRPSAAQLLKHKFIASAPGSNILIEKVSRSAELISQGALAKKDDEDEDDVNSIDHQKKSDGTIKDGTQKFFAGNNNNQTMKAKATKGGSSEQLTADFGTMVVNDSQTTTMKTVDANGTTTPSFMKMMREKSVVNDGTIKTPPKQSQPQPKSDSITELNEMLKAIEDSMEKEIKTIKQKYDQKRQPILDALRAKTGSPGM